MCVQKQAYSKMVITKADLDTILTAYLHLSDSSVATEVAGSDIEAQLNDPTVLCIESGGTGQIHLSNYDHHDPSLNMPTAAMQSYITLQCSDVFARNLVQYVSVMDDSPQRMQKIGYPTLSSIISGNLMQAQGDQLKALSGGIKILLKLRSIGANPFEPIRCSEFDELLEIKAENRRNLEKVLDEWRYFVSTSKLKVGLLVHSCVGGSKFLFSKGCDIAVLYNPETNKVTVCGKNDAKRITDYMQNTLTLLNNRESGWGGRVTIYGSPFSGTMLEIDVILGILASC